MPFTGPTIAASNYTDAVTNAAPTVTVTVTAGCRVLLPVSQSQSSSATLSGVTDDQGNTWTQVIVGLTASSTRKAYIWHAVVASSGTLTITATYSSAINWHICAVALSGAADLDTSNSLDNSSAGNTFHAAPSGSIDTVANTLLISLFSLNAAVTTWVVGSGFTAIRSSVTANYVYHSQYLQSEAGETDQRAGCTTTGSARTGPGVVVAYKAVATTSDFLHYLDPLNGGF